jgi:hypothetical protein
MLKKVMKNFGAQSFCQRVISSTNGLYYKHILTIISDDRK